MPLEVGETINHFADSFLRSQSLHAVAKNPIYTALAITFIVILIVLFIFRDAEVEESMFTMSMRTGFWVFLMTLGVIFLHNKVLTDENIYEKKDEVYNGVFSEPYSGSFEDNIVPVNINTDFTI